MSLLLCEPRYFNISYEINPWMRVQNNVNYSLATEQWLFLYRELKELTEVVLIDSEPELPDMVFTANAALITPDKHVFLSRFLYSERQPEEKYFKKWFELNGFESITQSTYPFEGAGDALYFENHLVLAHGFRSNPEVIKEISLSTDFVIHVKLIDPRFYHLDTCFCPLNNGDYLIFPSAFDKESLEKIRGLGGNEITVNEEEATKFACNAVLVNGNHVMMPKGCPLAVGELSRMGYHPHEFDMTEFIKSGGACKCLTLSI